MRQPPGIEGSVRGVAYERPDSKPGFLSHEILQLGEAKQVTERLPEKLALTSSCCSRSIAGRCRTKWFAASGPETVPSAGFEPAFAL